MELPQIKTRPEVAFHPVDRIRPIPSDRWRETNRLAILN